MTVNTFASHWSHCPVDILGMTKSKAIWVTAEGTKLPACLCYWGNTTLSPNSSRLQGSAPAPAPANTLPLQDAGGPVLGAVCLLTYFTLTNALCGR